MTGRWRTMADLEALPAAEQAVLMAMAGLGLPAGNAHLAQAVARAGAHPDAHAWAANPRAVQDLLARLGDQGLAEARQGHWVCAPASQESAARLAYRRGLLRRFYDGGAAGLPPDGARRSLAELRLTFMEGRPERWLPLRDRFRITFPSVTGGRDPLALLCGAPFEGAWFGGLEAASRAYGANALLQDALLHAEVAPGFLEWLDLQAAVPGARPMALACILHAVLQGRPGQARAWMAVQPDRLRSHPSWPCLEGLAALAEGRPEAAVDAYRAARAGLARSAPKAPPALPALHAPFEVLALMGDRRPGALDRAEAALAEGARRSPPGALADLQVVLGHLGHILAGVRDLPPLIERLPKRLSPLATALAAIASHLAGEPEGRLLAERALKAVNPLPFAWFQAELQELVRRERGESIKRSPLLDLLPVKAPWERALEGMKRLGASAGS